MAEKRGMSAKADDEDANGNGAKKSTGGRGNGRSSTKKSTPRKTRSSSKKAKSKRAWWRAERNRWAAVAGVAVLALLGLWWSTTGDPARGTPVWDGERFVLVTETEGAWGSEDGNDWDRVRVPLVAAALGRCPSGFNCRAEAPPPEPIELLHGQTHLRPMAATEEAVLIGEYRDYSLHGDELQKPPSGLLDLLADDGDPCFRRAAAAYRTEERPADVSILTGIGTDGPDSYSVTATCLEESNSSEARIQLDDHLTAAELSTAFSVCIKALWIERPGIMPTPLTDAPRQGRCVSRPTATDEYFYSLDGDDLVRSTDGTEWEPVSLPRSVQHLHPSAVLANPPASIAIALSPSADHSGSDRWAIVSNDDGATWTEPTVKWPFVHRPGIGPGGLLSSDSNVVEWADEDGISTLMEVDDGTVRLDVAVSEDTAMVVISPTDDGPVSYAAIPLPID